MQISDLFFRQHPEPMWVFDTETLRFLDVNQAAIDHYGYSRDAFLAMTIADIRPAEDVPRLIDNLRQDTGGRDTAGVWRHRTQSGAIIHVRITSFGCEFEGRSAEIVSAIDVTDLMEAQQALAGQALRERHLKEMSEASAARFQSLFETVPSKLMVLAPGTYEVLAVSDAYLRSVHYTRERLLGQPLFAVLDDSQNRPAEALAELRASLKRAEATRSTDIMAIQYYPPGEGSGTPEGERGRYWSASNACVLNADRSVSYILHELEDVTELVAADTAAQSQPGNAGLHPGVKPEQVPAILKSRELKRANLKLLEQETNLRTAQRLLSIGIWKMDLVTSRLELSPNLYGLFGVDRETFSHDFEGYVAIVHPEDRDEMVENYRRFEAEGSQLLQFGHRIIKSNGQVAFVTGVGEVARTLDGAILTGVVQDVTEQQAQTSRMKLLDESVARLNDMIVITEAEPLSGPEGPRIVFVNDAFLRHTGYSLEETLGQTPRIVQGPLTQRDELDRIGRALRSWEPVRSELINYDRHGNPFWVELDIVPVANASGWYTHWISVQRIISDRKRAELDRARSEERFRLVTEATHDVIWDWDRETNSIWWNANFARRFGYDNPAETHTPATWASYLHTDDRDRVLASLRAFLDGTATIWSEEYRFLHANGDIRWASVHALAVRDSSGLAVRVTGSMLDTTEQRALQDRLRQSERLEATGQLTGGLAHDFNNLLTVILGNSESLTNRLPEGALRERAELILNAALSGAELIRRLLAFGRRQPLDPRPHDLNQLAGETLALIRRTLPENIAISLDPAADLWAVSVDAPQLQAALVNLCLNARDAMPAGGTLTISTSNVPMSRAAPGGEPRDHVVLSVADTGEGMTPDVLARVFEPFFTTKAPGQGSGLGLSMVYGFVHQSGGEIRLDSEPGKGTRAELYFPRSALPLDFKPASPVTADDDFPHLLVLVVEDSEPVRQHACQLLRDLGMSVTHAADGHQALARLRENPAIDFLFTDIVLPGDMNGADLAVKARAMRPGLKVLYTSGYTGGILKRPHGKGQIKPLLAKPYRREDLKSKLREVLKQT